MSIRSTVKSGGVIVAGIVVGGVAATALSGVAFGTETVPDALIAESGVQAAWDRAVADSDLDLPGGVEFPTAAPAYFDQTAAEGANLYEEGIFESFVHTFWRCSWLEVSTTPGTAPSLLTEAATELAASADAPGAGA